LLSTGSEVNTIRVESPRNDLRWGRNHCPVTSARHPMYTTARAIGPGRALSEPRAGPRAPHLAPGDNEMTRLLVLLAAVTAIACAGSGPRAADSSAPAPFKEGRIVKAGDLGPGTATTLLEALERRFPNAVGSRDTRAWADRPVVYINGCWAGGLEQLAHLTVSDVAELRLLSALEATARYGAGHRGGAILVRLR
jgi:hypothetical protein